LNQPALIEALEPKLKEAINLAVAANITGIAAELHSAEDGNLSVSVGIKLNLNGNRVSGTGSVTYSRKFKDDFDFITDDPEQIKMEGIE
jgi:hypothetical protein